MRGRFTSTPHFLSFVTMQKGTLFLNKRGYLGLQVPNSLAMGVFFSLAEPGLILPKYGEDRFNAFLSVMLPEEVQTVGADNINERGKQFEFEIGPVDKFHPQGSDSKYAEYYFIQCSSTELAKLRRTYGLESQPPGGFMIVCGVRPYNVYRNNGVSKLREVVRQN